MRPRNNDMSKGLPYTYSDKFIHGLEFPRRTLLMDDCRYNVCSHEQDGNKVYQVVLWAEEKTWIESVYTCMTIEQVFATIVNWERRRLYEEHNITDTRYM